MLGFILTILIFIFIMIGIISSYSKKDEVVVPNNALLYIKLDNPVKDRAPRNPFENFDIGPYNSFKTMGLNDILRSIEKATKDPRIKGIYMNLDIVNVGISSLDEIRNALLKFKESGKMIITYSEVLSQKAYFLASVSDKIYLNPKGMLDFRGFNSESVYIKGTLDKLEIKPQILRGSNNEFKSAAEPLIYDKMSEANREQIKVYLTSTWDNMITKIADARKLNVAELNVLVNEMKIQYPEDAFNYHLVDSLLYMDQVLDDVKSRLGVAKIEDIKHISIAKYKDAHLKGEKLKRKKDKIAVVYASGDIVPGKGDENTIGSETFARTIRKARMDENIKAIVLRVNSPGGSALASEVVWREVRLAKQVKPVVVSMGDLAASGGYYISCAADTIVSEPTTITGSIGVFGVIYNLKDFFNHKLGMTFDNVKTHEHADFASMNRPLTEFETHVIQNYIDNIYSTFKQHVSDGRKLPLEMVDSIARGRIWSGTDAKKLGLVDVIGGMDDAIKIAAYMAKIKEYKIVPLPKQKDPWEQIFETLTGDSKISLMKQELGDYYDVYEQYKYALKMNGPQTRMLFVLNLN